jgi:acetoin utilization deacetylase AcuC-like enzyme
MKVFFDCDCLLHDPPHEFLSGRPVPYYEAPRRILLIKEALEKHPALFRVVATDLNIDVKTHILKVHSAEYLAYLEKAYAEWVKDGGDKVRTTGQLTLW